MYVLYIHKYGLHSTVQPKDEFRVRENSMRQAYVYMKLLQHDTKFMFYDKEKRIHMYKVISHFSLDWYSDCKYCTWKEYIFYSFFVPNNHLKKKYFVKYICIRTDWSSYSSYYCYVFPALSQHTTGECFAILQKSKVKYDYLYCTL